VLTQYIRIHFPFLSNLVLYFLSILSHKVQAEAQEEAAAAWATPPPERTAIMDAHHSPPAQPGAERHGSFSYDIESTDGPWRGAGAGAGQDRSSEALLRYDDRYDDDGPREPLLRKRTMNTTSQIAIVGANVCPIESLDYEYALHTPSVAPLLDTVDFPKAFCADSAKMFDVYCFLVVIATKDRWFYPQKNGKSKIML